MTNATDAAISVELKLSSYNKKKDGTIVSFVVQQDDRIKLAHYDIGDRFMAALVLLGDDEKPLPPKAPPSPLVQKAGILCSELDFQKFLHAEWPLYWRDASAESNDPEMRAARVLRELCGIQSRRELATFPKAQEVFEQLIVKYDQWRREGK